METTAETDSLQSCFRADGRTGDHNATRQRAASYLTAAVQISPHLWLAGKADNHDDIYSTAWSFQIEVNVTESSTLSTLEKNGLNEHQRTNAKIDLKRGKKMLRMFLPCYGRQSSWNGKSSHCIVNDLFGGGGHTNNISIKLGIKRTYGRWSQIPWSLKPTFT